MKWNYSIGNDGELITLISGNENELKRWRDATELAIKNGAINPYPTEDVEHEEIKPKQLGC